MIEMRIIGVRVEMPNQQPILVLTEVNGSRSLPILIGSAEATAIAMHQQGVRPSRPLTHDLLGQVITALGRSVVQVRVVDFREGTFFGELAFDDGTTVSARPSDAIALAVRVEIPVFVEDAVLAEAGIVLPEQGDEDDPDVDEADEVTAEDEVERFREFLDTISPDDFGGGAPKG
ncbi:bifunctional nuclease family protein [Nakamurella flavida]|uniref:Bifunctional nuclease family protein n=1 Tax=Nakamurella flavida TaxID=363630 RepID=A0A939C226_9ACTN|nr:bifunctional nuclease family protein [Nakamurella flavida]MBM9478303.1 bifunctional nuclease family protein [Nakamurella flavida]MDP9777526.1 bifunctional DNase/RNase [Nakamurella flavida]